MAVGKAKSNLLGAIGEHAALVAVGGQKDAEIALDKVLECFADFEKAVRFDELEKFRAIAMREGDAAGVGVDGEGGHA